MIYIFVLLFNLTLAFAEHTPSVTQGACEGYAAAYDIPLLSRDQTFAQKLEMNSVHAASKLTARTLCYGADGFQDIHKTVLNIPLQACCDQLCAGLAKGRESGNLDYLSHKLFHAVVGGFRGALDGANAMAASAGGAALGEIFAELFVDKQALYKQAIKQHPGDLGGQKAYLIDRLDVPTFLAKTFSALGVGVAGGDAQIAYDAADRAIENNFIQFVLIGLAGVYAGYMANELVQAYNRGGWEEVARVAHMEIELGLATSGGHVPITIGGKVYSTAQKAWNALVQQHPSLATGKFRHSFGKWLQSKGVGAEHVKELYVKPHGNSKHFKGETHAYVIRDADGNIHKVGESMQGVNKFGLSKRAEEQVRRLERETKQKFESDIRKTFATKKEARDYETWLIQSLRKRYGEDMLPGNKGVH